MSGRRGTLVVANGRRPKRAVVSLRNRVVVALNQRPLDIPACVQSHHPDVFDVRHDIPVWE